MIFSYYILENNIFESKKILWERIKRLIWWLKKDVVNLNLFTNKLIINFFLKKSIKQTFPNNLTVDSHNILLIRNVREIK